MHVQAITTKFIGPSNHRGSRIRAKAAAGSIIVAYNSGWSTDRNHDEAAHALCRKFGWRGTYIRGGMPDECGNVYVATLDGRADGFTVSNVP